MAGSNAVVDVLIIGGGPAGLAAAASLMRQRHSVILFDSGSYRNERAGHMHLLPSLDHVDPARFRTSSRQQLIDRYTTLSIQECEVEKIAPQQSGEDFFTVTDTSGKSWYGRKVILACGNADRYPVIEGYADAWARRM